MIVSRARALLGTITKLPALVRIFVARHVISLTMPSLPPIVTQCPTRNGFSIWMASPAKRLPSVSCSAKPITTALTAVVARIFSCRISVADDGEQHDDDRVLQDVREAIGHVIGAPRIEQPDDDEVDEAEGERERLGRAEKALEDGRERDVREHRARHRVEGEERRGQQQPAAQVAVDARGAERDGGDEECEPGDQRRPPS